MKKDRMRLARIRPPQHDQVGLFIFALRAGAPARPEYRRQTDDAGGVSGAVAAVNVVAADDAPRKLLREIVHLVGRLRTAEHPEALCAAAAHDGLHPAGRAIERFVPGRLAQYPAVAHEGSREPRL